MEHPVSGKLGSGSKVQAKHAAAVKKVSRNGPGTRIACRHTLL